MFLVNVLSSRALCDSYELLSMIWAEFFQQLFSFVTMNTREKNTPRNNIYNSSSSSNDDDGGNRKLQLIFWAMEKKLWITEANLGTQCASALMIAQWTKFECKLCNDITIDWNRWVLRKCSQAHTPTEQSATVIHIIVEKYECAYMNNFNDKLKCRKKKSIHMYL